MAVPRWLFAAAYALCLCAWYWICAQHYAIHDNPRSRVVVPAISASAVERAKAWHRASSQDAKANAAAPTATRLKQLYAQQHRIKAEAPQGDRIPAHIKEEAIAAAADASAVEADAAAAAAAAAAPKPKPKAAFDASECPKRSPYHTLLTAQSSTYQAWQSRIMHFHWKKQAAADGPCTDMTGFTRIVASEGARPDGLEEEMPSYFVRSYTTAEIARYGHFGVLNRPFSVMQFIQRGGMEGIAEEYVYIAETDHVLMVPLPNLATPSTPAAFGFGYMHASGGVQGFIDRHAPAGTSWKDVQPVGPSPLIISKAMLSQITPLWLNISLALKLDPDADKRFGWVLEMWGYSIAAASLHIKHTVTHQFQTEGGAGISAAAAKARGTYIFHYTYGIEYTLQGRPQGVNQIGEWSLDKRHYGSAYPPKNMQAPPNGASDGAQWLLSAWNEASAGIPTWPPTRALGTVGWRRTKGDGIATSPLAQRVHAQHPKWKWGGNSGLVFQAAGELKTPWGTGIWGALPRGVDYNDDGFCTPGCLFADFAGALHNVRFDLDGGTPSAKTYRLGDAENVPLTPD